MGGLDEGLLECFEGNEIVDGGAGAGARAGLGTESGQENGRVIAGLTLYKVGFRCLC